MDLSVELYLDHAATAPPRREVLEAMWPHLTAQFGNPSSVHGRGLDAERALEAARAEVAQVLGGRPSEVTFTSGGTESDNLAVKGIALARRDLVGANRVVISGVEHPAVAESAAWLARQGFTIQTLGVDATGRVDPDELAELLQRPGVAVVSVQYANNEVGTIQPIAELAAIARAAGVPLHTDAVQAAGWCDLDVAQLGIDALSLAGHKLGGPGGLLWLRRGTPCEPLLHGGGQEAGLRSGTVRLADAVGLAAALTLARAEGDAEVRAADVETRNAFIARVLGAVVPLLPNARLTGHPRDRLGRHASFVLGGVSGEALLVELEARGVLVSSGSACHAGSDEPSEVLTAMGIGREEAQTAVRFSWGRHTPPEWLERAAQATGEAVRAILA